MKSNGFKPRMSSKWLICNGLYKGQASTLSFTPPVFVR